MKPSSRPTGAVEAALISIGPRVMIAVGAFSDAGSEATRAAAISSARRWAAVVAPPGADTTVATPSRPAVDTGRWGAAISTCFGFGWATGAVARVVVRVVEPVVGRGAVDPDDGGWGAGAGAGAGAV